MRPFSLRARLIATLLVLTTVGMLVLAGVTYFSQREFENQRVDDQTLSALPAVGRELNDKLGSSVFPDPPGGRFGGGFDAEANLPPGVYGQRRDAAGNILGNVVITYGETAPSPPELPATLRAGQLLTVDSVDGDDRYRVRVQPDREGTLTIVAIPLSGVDETLDRLLLVEGLVIGGVLLLLGAASWLLVRAGLRPLERIGHTADAIAAGDLSHRIEGATPRTEVGRLGLALNAMLGRLETAFAERAASEGRLRQFLSDASHELRTPLASIRGYAELFRIGAARSPEDLEKAMKRIEEEAERMGVLVEDLLVLARLDEVREARAEDVDVSVLAEDAAADARAMDPSREVRAEVDGEAVVHGDPDQLRQVLANLVRNALMHTPSGTPVEITSRRENGHVDVEVRDHGPGLPPGDPQALFERFWRAEAGRERGRAGAGLGLAIVAGIVQAHGGDVEAANAEGGGASFRVRLPLT